MLVGGRTLGEYVHDVGAEGSPHDHVVLTMEDGGRVTFNDARRFGVMDLWPTADLAGHRLLSGIGPEPLGNDFSADTLALAFRGKAAPVKAALLDQGIVAGLGNIYVCEALWRARVSPRKPAGKVSGPALERITTAVREVLAEAIEAGGSTLRDFAGAGGDLGYFQHGFAAYGREGEPCGRADGGTIRRIVQGGRSTFFCPRCQR
jgi:formamidopyrimidine-DNA glycosylase